MVLVNPLHAALPGFPQTASPYFPSSRCFLNPIYLSVADVPGADEVVDLAALADAGRALNDDRLIDRDAVWRLKSAALESVFAATSDPDPGLLRFCASGGRHLANYATFCAIWESHGPSWASWPEGLRRADAPEVAAFAEARPDRVRYHQWLQWLLDRQLAAVASETSLMVDLAVGVDPGGADAWIWQDTYAPGFRIGAPPDDFNTGGQNWGLAAFDPRELAAQAYEPFVVALRAAFRHASGVRIDHVMAMFRLFWVPEGGGPGDGAYVRYPAQDMLDIVARESRRARTWVVGEDLGTVEDGVREELARRNVLSCRLLWFEPGPPSTFPSKALAAVTTHDLPTVAGLWTGADLAEQRRLHLNPNEDGTAEIRRRLCDWTGLGADGGLGELIVTVHRLLAEAPSAVVTATLDDALGVETRPNLPGTTDERPNWCLALPKSLEEIELDHTVARVAAALSAGRR